MNAIADAPPPLKTLGVGVKRGGRWLLRNIDLTFRPGLSVIVGANGAGKSTLLNVLAGDIRPSEGVVHCDGRPLTRSRRRELARRRAVMPQVSSTVFPYTCGEIVSLGRLPWGDTPAQCEAHVRTAMRSAAVDTFYERVYPTLSGGEQNRVQFARTLAQISNRRGILLLDEPTSSLDIVHAVGLLDRARYLADSGATVVAVLHDLNQVLRVATRVIVLKNGACVADGEPRQTLTPETLWTAFGVRMERAQLSDGRHILCMPAQESRVLA